MQLTSGCTIKNKERANISTNPGDIKILAIKETKGLRL